MTHVRAVNRCTLHRRMLQQFACSCARMTLWMGYELSMLSEVSTDLSAFAEAYTLRMAHGGDQGPRACCRYRRIRRLARGDGTHAQRR